MTDQYVTRAKNVAVAQYASIKSALERTLGLAFKIFDEYANILTGMYSTRFNGCPKNNGDYRLSGTSGLSGN